jgi:putative membrane protein
MKKLLITGLSGLTLFTTAGGALAQQGGYGGPGWQHPMMWGGGWLGGPMMIIFWIAVLVIIIMGIRWAVKGSGGSPVRGAGNSAVLQDSALELLKRRYAAGEIERDEYMAKKRDLEA